MTRTIAQWQKFQDRKSVQFCTLPALKARIAARAGAPDELGEALQKKVTSGYLLDKIEFPERSGTSWA